MTGIERRQYEMLVRVRNFGEINRGVFASSPVAQEMFTAVGTAVDNLSAADMKKMAASASARADRREEARVALRELLQHVAQLARTLRAEGRTMPAFSLPRSKSAVTLLTAGRQFALDVKPLDADFAGHGLGAAHITVVTAAFEQALNTQGVSRTEHVAARAYIRGVVAAAVRSVRRLDLIVANELRGNEVLQSQWAQVRRVETPRTTRGGTADGTQSLAATDAAVATESATDTLSSPVVTESPALQPAPPAA